ncbi:hypothetical protein GF360_02970 [candidate division WWE3 bacterium]|nr:hypothetical protein [candidate division WWE3 bacterium]
MDKQILENEKKHLAEVLEIVKEAKKDMEESLKSLGAETVDKLEELRDNPETNAMDFFLFLEQIHQKHEAFNLKDRYKRIEELKFSLDEPYFARIDLQKQDLSQEVTEITGGDPEGDAQPKTRKVYIGKFGFTDEHTPVITDWRTKIASVYYRYRYPQKDVHYETPEGTKTRDLLLKRTFDIEEGELNKYYNNDIQLDESEIIVEKIESRTGGVLEDIVETIQEAQLDIIEEDPRTPCVVQGCVGSGKSTVAIHRLSHIFFNYKELIKPERSILIANKQILVSYLATLFPKLGIFDINYKTLSDLVYNFIFREELGLEVDFSLPLKGDLLALETLEKARSLILEIEEDYKTKMEAVFKGEHESFGGYAYDPEVSPYENLQYVVTELSEELKTQKELLKENPNSPRLWLYKLNVSALKKILKKLNTLKHDLKKKDLKALLKKLGLNPNNKLDYASTLLYVYAYSRLIGFANTRRYHYCVVDEGQDFSPLEYAVLDTFILHKRFCILGDLNQGYTKHGLKDWQQLEEVFQTDDLKEFKLKTNYRSTKPIIDLANKILKPFTSDYLPQSINRRGEEPSLQSFKRTEDMYDKVEADLKGDIKSLKKSIGVICYHDKDFEQMQEVLGRLPLEDERKTVLASDKRIDYKPKSVYLTKFGNCKGLEFAKVYIVGRNPLDNTTFAEAKRSFVGVTRAMDKVSAYYVD